MSPTMVINQDGSVEMVVGAAGGLKIPSAIAWTIMKRLWANQSLKEAVDTCRTHHSLEPMKIFYEIGFPEVSPEF